MLASVLLTVVTIAIVGWQIGIQVQVNHVDAIVPPTFDLLTTNTTRHINYFMTSASPLYISSSGIDTSDLLVVTIVNNMRTLSGKYISNVLTFVAMRITFNGDGHTTASLTVLSDGTHGMIIGGMPCNLPMLYKQDVAPFNVTSGRMTCNPLNTNEITYSITPRIGASIGFNYLSYVISFTTDAT
jgi:hypothetical protein